MDVRLSSTGKTISGNDFRKLVLLSSQAIGRVIQSHKERKAQQDSEVVMVSACVYLTCTFIVSISLRLVFAGIYTCRHWDSSHSSHSEVCPKDCDSNMIALCVDAGPRINGRERRKLLKRRPRDVMMSCKQALTITQTALQEFQQAKQLNAEMTQAWPAMCGKNKNHEIP